MQITTHSEEETKHFAKELAAKLVGGDILCLYGELGAGKTTFVKGLAEGLGVTDNITSPTFSLMNVYNVIAIRQRAEKQSSPRQKHEIASSSSSPRNDSAIKKLVHIDTYRLKNEEELIEIGAEDYVGAPDAITIIEWPEKIANFLKAKKFIKIFFDHASTDNDREIIYPD